MRPEPGLKGCSCAHAQAEKSITGWANKRAKPWGGEGHLMCMFVGTCGVHCIQNMERVTKVQFKIADCTLLNSLKIIFSDRDL